MSTLDAFVLAYHAAESLCRQILALLEGGGPGGLPLIALSELKAGPAFNDRLSRLAGLSDADLSELLDYLFLPTEIQETWPDDSRGSTASRSVCGSGSVGLLVTSLSGATRTTPRNTG